MEEDKIEVSLDEPEELENRERESGKIGWRHIHVIISIVYRTKKQTQTQTKCYILTCTNLEGLEQYIDSKCIHAFRLIFHQLYCVVIVLYCNALIC